MLFEPGKTEQTAVAPLADAIEATLRDPARVRALGAAARAEALEKYSLRGMAAAFTTLAGTLGVKNR